MTSGERPPRPKRLRRAATVVGGILLVLGALLLAEGWKRSALPYNEQGRYFDERYSVVYHDYQGGVYLLLGAALAGGGALLVAVPFAVRARRRRTR